jgi:peptidoglycan-associated lipoprotein
MLKTLITASLLGIVGARILPAALIGAMSMAASALTARVLFITFVGLAPVLLVAGAGAEDRRPGPLPLGLVAAAPPQGPEQWLGDFAPRPELRSVGFDMGRAEIRPADRKVLDANIEWLAAHPSAGILIEGAADPRGARAHNLALGERRARAVRDYLVIRGGIAPDRITIVSAGDAKRACRDMGEACWALDRRADFFVKERPRQAP